MNAEGIGFVDPKRIIAALGVVPGSLVADFGCGAGYFSFEFAKATGPEGRVYSLDVLPSALEAVASRAKLQNIGNIETKRVNLEKAGGSGIGDGLVDWVVLKDMLFQNKKKDVIVKEMARVMKPGGHGIIMEWNPKAGAVGPEKELRIAPETLKQLLESAGLLVEKEIPAWGYHYAFVVKK